MTTRTNFEKICEHCGHRVQIYTHTLNVHLVDALAKLVEYYEKHKKRCQLGTLQLSTQQYSNFQKLQYFGLVHRNTEGWVPTDRAFQFIYGVGHIISPVATFGRDILPSSHEYWSKKARIQKPRLYMIHEISAYHYKKREDYVESNTMPNLFDAIV